MLFPVRGRRVDYPASRRTMRRYFALKSEQAEVSIWLGCLFGIGNNRLTTGIKN